MYINLEQLPTTLVFKKSKQNLELLSQHYDIIWVKSAKNRNIAIPIRSLVSDDPKDRRILELVNAQTPRKVFNHAKLKEILLRKQIHPLVALDYIKELLK